MKTEILAVIGLRRFTSAFCMILFLSLLGAQVPAAAQARTVIDKQVGSIFQAPPSGVSYSAVGAFDGNFTGIDPDALHIRYATFQAFAPDNYNAANFPLTALQNYEAAEVAAGRPRIFVHATYAGKSRQVYFNFGGAMGLINAQPTTAQYHWYQAVNVCDPRFVRFWINHYQRPIVQARAYPNVPVFWTQNDNGAFNYGLYGVLDDNNHFVTGLTWDPEFPQGPAAFFQCMRSFYTQVAKLAPDIQQILNLGTWSDLSQYTTVMQDLPGVMLENLAYWSGSPSVYTRNVFYNLTATWFPWIISHGKVTLTRSSTPTSTSLLNGFVAYELLIAGGNGFFAPGNGSNIINPSLWLPWEARLGNPTIAMASTQVSSSGVGYRHYSRTFEGGTVYLNLGGTTWNISLTGGPWYDPLGNTIGSISLADGQGTFATTSSPGIPAAPMISPRAAFTYQAPLPVTLSAGTSGTIIRYTTNGTEPTSSSPVYSNPILLNASGTIKAKAFTSGGVPSHTNTMVYTVSSSKPVVTFANSTDYGPSGAYYPVLQLTELPAGPVSVSYSVEHSDGSVTTGTAAFLPHQTRPYRYFPVTIASASARITITGAVGAIVGPSNTLQYTVGSGP
jgi:Chitobiase/beta-hexosaminidase C-terminal domain